MSTWCSYNWIVFSYITWCTLMTIHYWYSIININVFLFFSITEEVDILGNWSSDTDDLSSIGSNSSDGGCVISTRRLALHESVWDPLSRGSGALRWLPVLPPTTRWRHAPPLLPLPPTSFWHWPISSETEPNWISHFVKFPSISLSYRLILHT